MLGADVGACFFFLCFVGFEVSSGEIEGVDVGACFFFFDFFDGLTVVTALGATVGTDEGAEDIVPMLEGTAEAVEEGIEDIVPMLEGVSDNKCDGQVVI